MDIRWKNTMIKIVGVSLISLMLIGCKGLQNTSREETVVDTKEVIVIEQPYNISSVKDVNNKNNKSILTHGKTISEAYILNNKIYHNLQNKDTVVVSKDTSRNSSHIKESNTVVEEKRTFFDKIKTYFNNIIVTSVILLIAFIAYKIFSIFKKVSIPL